MTYRDVYIAELADGADPLDWGDGKIAPRISPLFPQGGAAFSRLFHKVYGREYPGTIDWTGAFATRVSKQQIFDFIEETYGGNDWYTDAARNPYLYVEMQTLMDCVKSLPDDKFFALMGSEI